MKETIYTIPVNDAFNKDTECAICSLEKELEQSNIEYALGAALMEPDVRISMNEKGFCNRHYQKLFESQKNALGLSLILTSHHEETMAIINKKAKKRFDKMEKETKSKNKIKLASEVIEELKNALSKDLDTCFVCDRIDYTMDKYFDVIFFMWKNQFDFRKKFIESKGFCIKHTLKLLEYAPRKLGKKDLPDFLEDLYALFMINFDRNEEDLRWFTKKFDYQYKDASWKNSKDILPRFIEKVSGYTDLD